MSETLIILISAWLAINLVIAPAIGLRVARLGSAEPSPLRHPRVLSAEAYVSILPSRLVVQACRVLGASGTCLLVRRVDGSFIVAAAHGMREEEIGARTAISGVPPRTPEGRTSSGPVVMLCADTANRVRARDQTEQRLLSELTSLCAAAVEDADPNAGFERAVRSCAEGLAAVDRSEGGVIREARIDLISLVSWIGTRLGLDRSALIELRLAARVYEISTVTRGTTVRLGTETADATWFAGPDPGELAVQVAHLPGFEVVALIVGLLGERWDGRGHPHRLRGERIPLASRILAACGAVWTLTTKAPHGAGAPMESALRCVQATSGSVFDPTVVMALSEELIGEVPPVGDAARAAWARADALYSVLS